MSNCCIICADHCDLHIINSAAQWWQRLHPILVPNDDITTIPASATFCRKCNSGFEQLIIFKSELERLEKELKSKVDALRKQVAGSQGRFLTRNLEDVRFREKLMGEYACATIAYQPQIFPSMPTLVPVQQFQLQNEFNIYQIPIPNSAPVTVTIPHILQEDNSNNYSNDVEIGMGEESNSAVSEVEDSDENFEPDDNNSNSSDSAAENEEEKQNIEPIPVPQPAPIIIPPKKGRPIRKRKAVEIVDENTEKKPKKAKKPPEHFFAPLVKTGENQFSFEGFEIIKLNTGFYQCVSCGWTENNNGLNWMKVRTLKVHIYGLHLGKYKCEQCNATFKSYQCLKIHNSWLHPDLGAVPADQRTCTICKEPYRNGNGEVHMWTHKSKAEKEELIAAGKAPKMYRRTNSNCKFCHKKITFTNNRVRHERICTKNPNADKEPTNEFSQLHLEAIRRRRRNKFKNLHPDHDSLEEPDVATKRKPRTGPRPLISGPLMNIICETCGKTIKHRSYLTTHWWTHMNAQERGEARAKGEAPLQTKMWDKDVQCPICGILVQPSYITKHAEIHQKPEERKKISCDFPGCTKTFFRIQGFNYHKLLAHNPEKINWINCPAPGCGKRFMQHNKMTRHCVANHRDLNAPKFFICDICDAPFTLKVELTTHKRIHKKNNHTKDMYILECPKENCSRKFVDIQLLKTHVTQLHKEKRPPEKPKRVLKLTCPICLSPVTNCRIQEQHVTWIHKNVEEMCATLNAGTMLPRALTDGYRKCEIKQAFLPKEKHGFDIRCNMCKDEDFDTVINLSKHITAMHPECEKKKPKIVKRKRKKGPYSAIKYTTQIKFTCHICLSPVTARGLESHLTWLHKNIEEMCTSLNAGNKIPDALTKIKRFKPIRLAFLPKEKHQVEIKCNLCKDLDFDRVMDLSEHICEWHPDLGTQICEKRMPAIVLDPVKTGQSEEGLEVLSINGEVVARVGDDGRIQFI